jgi:hypothetical protein
MVRLFGVLFGYRIPRQVFVLTNNELFELTKAAGPDRCSLYGFTSRNHAIL